MDLPGSLNQDINYILLYASLHACNYYNMVVEVQIGASITCASSTYITDPVSRTFLYTLHSWVEARGELRRGVENN